VVRIRLLIVGFDPGTKAGLAIIDTFGRVVMITSKTNTSISSFAQMILKHGKPLIVATDKRPTPKNVEKLAKSLGAKVYFPVETMSIHEKVEIAKRYDIKVKNDHERDAVAAAFKAYKQYVSLLRKINTSLSSLGLNHIYNKVVESMIFGYADNIDEAINKALTQKEVKEEKKEIIKQPAIEKPVEVKRLERDVEILKKYNEKLLEEIKKLKRRKRAVSKDFSLRKEFSMLSDVLKQLKSMRRLELEGKIPLVEVKDMSCLEQLDELIDLKGRVVLVDFGDLRLLNKYEIKAAVSMIDVDKSKLEFPVVVLESKDIKQKDNIKFIEASLFEEKIKEARKEGLVEWVKDYRKRKI
jgi:predicted RNase H-like nuclease (RuvC/YqgF family)